MTKVLAIFGYNNTRLYDVKKLKTIIASQGIELILCKEGITREDQEVSQYCLDVKLHGTHQEIEQTYLYFNNWLVSHKLELVGILPFSDRGILLGSYVAEKMQLISDDYFSAIRGLNKYAFRVAESETTTPAWYKKPSYKKIQNTSELAQFLDEIKLPVFVKPTSEGNSRGCFLVETIADLDTGFESVKPYLNEGAIAEEYISNGREFSFDTVAGKCWITEKETTVGHYRAEIQQIVPAPLSDEAYSRLIEAGKIMAEISGSKGGAAHNEIFLLPDNTVAAVEPNRRPAGMHIWDMASRAFDNFNPFESWVNWSLGRELFNAEVLTRKRYVGIRMIQATADGEVSKIDYEALHNLKVSNSCIFDISISRNIGDSVFSEPKDNAGFLGYIIVEHENPQELKNMLKNLCIHVRNFIDVISPITQLLINATKEEIINFDGSYLRQHIEEWWSKVNPIDTLETRKEQLRNIMLAKFEKGEQNILNKVGIEGHHISGVIIKGLFSTDHHELAHIVHEVLSDLAKIKDIKYPYENHKTLYVIPEGINRGEWGNGSGEISPHCDDLYEDCEVALLSSTTCRDNLGVSTLLYMATELFKILSDQELDRLSKITAVFISGMNVNGIIKERERPVLTYKKNNFFIALDYRVDEKTGPRMRIENKEDLALFDKIKERLTPERAIKAPIGTGTFFVIANNKVLHGRERLVTLDHDFPPNIENTPRLLFRSKGSRL